MKIDFNYKLENNGWAKVEVQAKDFKYDFNVSYIYDSLSSLITSSSGLLNGESNKTIEFFEEPGEHHFVIKMLDRKYIDFEIRWFGDSSFNKTNSIEFKTIYKGKTTLKSFILNVLNSVELILNQYGLDGYKENWGKDFPEIEYKELEKIIKNKA